MRIRRAPRMLVYLVSVLAATAGCSMAPAPIEESAARTPAPFTTETSATTSGTTGSTQAPVTSRTDEPVATVAPVTTTATATDSATIYVRSGSRIIAHGSAQPQFIDLQRGTEPVGQGPIRLAPDGSYLAFTENSPERSGLGLLSLRNSQQQFVPDIQFGGEFSPDGRSVVYTAVTQAGSQVSVRELETGEMRVVQQGDGTRPLRPIAWTPTGILAEQLLMFSDAPPQSLFLIDPAGGEPRQVRSESHVSATSTDDGSKIALVTGFLGMGVTGEAGLSVLDVATGNEQELVPQRTGLIRFVRWSPDGSKLLYSSAASNEAETTSLHLIADNSDASTLDLGDAGIAGTMRDAAWRDNGTLLVLVADGAGKLRLYELAADTFTAANLREIGTFEQAEPNAPAEILLAQP